MNSRVNQAMGGPDTGDLLKYFKAMDAVVEGNSGIHQNETHTEDANQPACPLKSGLYTRIPLTVQATHMTCFDKSHITCEIDLEVSWISNFWNDLIAKEEESDKQYEIEHGTSISNATKLARHYRNLFTRWFIGVKASTHFFDSYRIYVNGFKTSCEQTEAIYENALVRFLKPQEELDEKPEIYTTWKRAVVGDTCVCGTYFTLQDLLDATRNRENTKIVRINCVVPIDDFLPFNGFTIYPNAIFGQMSMELKLGVHSNLVICQVDPKEEFERMMRMKMMSSHAISACYNHLYGDIPNYTKTFTQLGDTFNSTIYTIDANGIFTNNTLPVTFAVQTGELITCRAHINGFNVKDSVLKRLEIEYAEKPLIIPAQMGTYQAFSQRPNGTSVQLNTTTGMVNVSSVAFMFPRTINEVTVSKNPHFSAVNCHINGMSFPNKPFSTHCNAHTMYCITNAGLDSLFSPSEEFSYSLTFNELQYGTSDASGLEYPEVTDSTGKVVSAAYSERGLNVRNPYKDNTSYCYLVATERLTGYGTFCDGLTGQSITVNCNCTMEGSKGENPYAYDQRRRLENILNGKDELQGTVNDRSPYMVMVQDCFWAMTSDGNVQFLKDDDRAYEQFVQMSK